MLPGAPGALRLLSAKTGVSAALIDGWLPRSYSCTVSENSLPPADEHMLVAPALSAFRTS